MKVVSTYLILLLISIVQLIHANEKKFYSINSLSGVSVRETRTVCEDKDGFIWTASKSGISRITNGDYRHYNLPVEASDILYIDLAYHDGLLYAYTSNGQILNYNRVLDKFEMVVNVRKVLNISYLAISMIELANATDCWVGTTFGLYRYSNEGLKMLTADSVHIFQFKAIGSKIYYASREQLVCLDTKTGKEQVISTFEPSNPVLVSRFYHDTLNKRLWVGTFSSGLYYVDLSDQSYHKHVNSVLPNQPVLAMTHNIDSTFMVGIDGQGVWHFDSSGNSLLAIYKEDLDKANTIAGDGVYDIFIDSRKRVWVSTYSGGLSYFEQKKDEIQHVSHQTNTLNSLGNNNINKVLQSRDGDIWFATNNGISRWRRQTNTWFRYLEDVNSKAKVFLALEEDADGNIWGGTYSSGIYVLDKHTGKELKHYAKIEQPGGFSSRFVFDILRDSRDNIWIGGNQGDLYCYNRKQNKFITYETSTEINKIVELPDSSLLLCSPQGLVKFSLKTHRFETLLSAYIINDMVAVGGMYWLATRGGGLLLFNPSDRSVESFTVENGLPSNYINSMTVANGAIWIGTENGLGKFDPVKKCLVAYNEDLLLSRLSFNVNSAIALNDGKLIWGTNKGAVLFNPENMNLPFRDAKLFIQDILIAGQSIRENDKFKLTKTVNLIDQLRLKYYQNTLSLEVLPIAETNDGLKLSWQLEGVEPNWSNPTNRFFINYANLPSGTFNLKIRLYDNSLTQLIDEREITITVVPPFWATWWFRLLLVLTIVFIVYYYFRYYTHKLREKHTEEKIRFFTTMAHDIRTSLTLIKAPVESISGEPKLSDKARYFISVASEQINRMSFVVTQLLDLQKVDIGKGQLFPVMTDLTALLKKRISMFELLAKNKNITIDLKADCGDYLTAVDELKIEKVVDNLVSNALKFSLENSTIYISLECTKEKWVLTVKDAGIGISQRDQKKLFKEFYRGDNAVNSRIVGSGIGLLLVKNYVDMHGGTVSLSSEEGQGSEFIVTVPYKYIEQQAVLSDRIAKEELMNIENATLPQLPGEDNELPKSKRSNLLVVEDNVELQNFLKVSLKDEFNVSIASNGLEAWLMIQKSAPDIIISDVMMPQMDGFELCRHLKSTFDTSHIPIILLTALTEKTQQLEGLGLGADDYITKPFDMSLLQQRIQTLVRNREVVRNRVLRMFREPNDDKPLLMNEQNDQFLKKAIDVVRANIDNSDFGKDEFAAAMFASSSLLYKKIKALTGQSPIDFIKVIRLDYSMELLRSRKYSVTEVSEMCGFSSVGYFSTVFKKHFQRTPTEI